MAINITVHTVAYIDHLIGTSCRDTQNVSAKWEKWDTWTNEER